jgi:16S rRNA (adenine1518-N6/adenine1519-N6)-dimethyltransferase
MQAKKSFGQHFLTREDISQDIADALTQIAKVPRVLEVGPGQGMLTKYLLKKNIELVAVEADRDMIGILNKKFLEIPPLSSPAKMRLLSEDFLQTDLKKVFDEQEFCLIGNFPYNISSQILFKMLDEKILVPEMVGMFQKEVAERVVAPSGSKTYGILSVLCQAFYEGEYLFTVDSHCFAPPPNVQSAVIRLRRKENLVLDCDEKLFKQIVKATFNQRRKMIRNTMKGFIKDAEVLTDAFFNLRPEQLNLNDFIKLTNLVSNTQR